MTKYTVLKCSDVLNEICDKLDQDIHSPKCKMIRRHLEDCPNCSAYLDSLKKTILLYKVYPRTKAPRNSTKKIFAKLKVR